MILCCGALLCQSGVDARTMLSSSHTVNIYLALGPPRIIQPSIPQWATTPPLVVSADKCNEIFQDIHPSHGFVKCYGLQRDYKTVRLFLWSSGLFQLFKNSTIHSGRPNFGLQCHTSKSWRVGFEIQICSYLINLHKITCPLESMPLLLNTK